MAPGYSPGCEGSAYLQPKVVVQTTRVVLLDHKDAITSWPTADAPGRFRCLAESPLLTIFFSGTPFLQPSIGSSRRQRPADTRAKGLRTLPAFKHCPHGYTVGPKVLVVQLAPIQRHRNRRVRTSPNCVGGRYGLRVRVVIRVHENSPAAFVLALLQRAVFRIITDRALCQRLANARTDRIPPHV